MSFRSFLRSIFGTGEAPAPVEVEPETTELPVSNTNSISYVGSTNDNASTVTEAPVAEAAPKKTRKRSSTRRKKSAR